MCYVTVVVIYHYLSYCFSPIDLADVLPRLWPYLDHSTSSVRKATLQTLRTLTRPLVTSHAKNNGQTDNNGNTDVNTNVDEEQCLAWTPELLQEAMRHIYQRVLFEHVHEIQEIAVQVRMFMRNQFVQLGC